ncbi:hypothetical protein BCY86_04350 [Pajaroellobacter abortibovis]|uniref:Uncharacterized protein n=1 Tax=Pajaroellobacter abortibovis TaxID=1882918 RepID=A0A1L6MWR9_9BACT|nr:hypothetical protein BCY86_04350 [Pajaroellobacter abortibovis]
MMAEANGLGLKEEDIFVRLDKALIKKCGYAIVNLSCEDFRSEKMPQSCHNLIKSLKHVAADS